MPRAVERRPFWILIAGTVVIDRITKVIAEAGLVSGPVEVIGDTLRWTLIYNPGAAFGLGDSLGSISRWLFLGIASLAIVMLERMSKETAPSDRLRHYALGLVAGGAAGNLIDRIISSRGVVDFIDVGLGSLGRWPTFNIADIAVSCGAILLALSFWMEDSRRRDQATN
jgi:signal peptidase II